MRAGARDAGFSLIEVLVVMLILGVLTFIALNSMGGGQGKADRHLISAGDRQSCEASARTIETAALGYYVDHEGTWPPDIAALADATPAYIRSMPKADWNLVLNNATGQVDSTGCDKL